LPPPESGSGGSGRTRSPTGSGCATSRSCRPARSVARLPGSEAPKPQQSERATRTTAARACTLAAWCPTSRVSRRRCTADGTAHATRRQTGTRRRNSIGPSPAPRAASSPPTHSVRCWRPWSTA
jgi:hypothetical protein